LQIVAEESRGSRQHHDRLKHHIGAASLSFFCSRFIPECVDLLLKAIEAFESGLIRRHRPWITQNCPSGALKADPASHHFRSGGSHKFIALPAHKTNNARREATDTANHR
jgi:hypothetical protein